MHTLFLLALTCLQTPAQSPPDPAPTLTLTANWKMGAKQRLELVKGREDWEADKLVKSSKLVANIDTEVMARSEVGFVIRWTYGHTSVVEGAGGQREFAERMASMNEGMQMDLRFSPQGVLQGLAEPEALQRHFAKMLTGMEKELLDKGMERKDVAELMRSLREKVLGPDFERSLLVEPNLYYRCAGLTFTLGKKVEFDTQLGNPLGGDAFPAKGWYQLEELDAQKHQARVQFGEALDPQKSRELILAWMAEVEKQSGKPAPVAPEDLPLKDLQESARFVLDLTSGTPHSVEHVRTLVVKTHKRIDRTLLRVLADASAPKPAEPDAKPR